MSATPPTVRPEQVQIQVDWSTADNLPIMASNIVLVQQTPHEFILTFAATVPPIITEPITPEQARGMKVTAQPIARIAFAPGRLVELLQTLQQQLAIFQQAQQH
jgi:hypothetical protein